MTHKLANKNILYDQLVEWFDGIKKHELTDIVTLVEKAKALVMAAESLPEDKVKQFISNFQYDLREFYQQYQSNVKHSLYLGLLNERFWSTLANVTDKSQVEWAELNEDFAHQSIYHRGDYIGFGELECQQCHQSMLFSHLTQLTECFECGGEVFLRKGLTP
ncbi:MAG: hypothetical protein ACI9LM_000830 [Alteromonadaceae bacterium]|jgi:hypothetical protein